jgi:hypothetical protein
MNLHFLTITRPNEEISVPAWSLGVVVHTLSQQLEDGVRTPPGEAVFYHPEYKNGRVLLRFWAYSVNEEHGPYVTYQFAYNMCMAMTDNTRPGYFTKSERRTAKRLRQKEEGYWPNDFAREADP